MPKRKCLNRKKPVNTANNGGIESNSMMPEANEDIVNSIESLMESATDYGKTSYDLLKLKIIDEFQMCFPL